MKGLQGDLEILADELQDPVDADGLAIAADGVQNLVSKPEVDSFSHERRLGRDPDHRALKLPHIPGDGVGQQIGHISGQVDMQQMRNEAAMKENAEEISALSPNVMVKIPGSTQGIPVFKHLASKGIATNATCVFTVPQIMAEVRKDVVFYDQSGGGATFSGGHIVFE